MNSYGPDKPILRFIWRRLYLRLAKKYIKAFYKTKIIKGM